MFECVEKIQRCRPVASVDGIEIAVQAAGVDDPLGDYGG